MESSGPVPDIGDEMTEYEEVSKFYDFWFSFKCVFYLSELDHPCQCYMEFVQSCLLIRSWREFPHPDEEDVEGAEGRDHKRWIERNNAKLREKAKKEDQKRLKEFVENAYKIDPRIAKKKEEERMEK